MNKFFMKIPAQIYFLLFVAIFFARNIFMPFTNDDYTYSFIWDGEHGGNFLIPREFEHRERVNSIGDIFQSQYSHYFTWGGRVVAHFIVQFFAWIGKNYFDIANTIIFALLILVILKIGNVALKYSKILLAWIFFCLFFVGAKFGQTMFWATWLTGACNYFWTGFFQLAFLLPYVMALRGKKFDNRLMCVLSAVGGGAFGLVQRIRFTCDSFFDGNFSFGCTAQKNFP